MKARARDNEMQIFQTRRGETGAEIRATSAASVPRDRGSCSRAYREHGAVYRQDWRHFPHGFSTRPLAQAREARHSGRVLAPLLERHAKNARHGYVRSL
jgi:hypothetical protein